MIHMTFKNYFPFTLAIRPVLGILVVHNYVAYQLFVNLVDSLWLVCFQSMYHGIRDRSYQKNVALSSYLGKLSSSPSKKVSDDSRCILPKQFSFNYFNQTCYNMKWQKRREENRYKPISTINVIVDIIYIYKSCSRYRFVHS